MRIFPEERGVFRRCANHFHRSNGSPSQDPAQHLLHLRLPPGRSKQVERSIAQSLGRLSGSGDPRQAFESVRMVTGIEYGSARSIPPGKIGRRSDSADLRHARGNSCDGQAVEKLPLEREGEPRPEPAAPATRCQASPEISVGSVSPRGAARRRPGRIFLEMSLRTRPGARTIPHGFPAEAKRLGLSGPGRSARRAAGRRYCATTSSPTPGCSAVTRKYLGVVGQIEQQLQAERRSQAARYRQDAQGGEHRAGDPSREPDRGRKPQVGPSHSRARQPLPERLAQGVRGHDRSSRPQRIAFYQFDNLLKQQFHHLLRGNRDFRRPSAASPGARRAAVCNVPGGQAPISTCIRSPDSSSTAENAAEPGGIRCSGGRRPAHQVRFGLGDVAGERQSYGERDLRARRRTSRRGPPLSPWRPARSRSRKNRTKASNPRSSPRRSSTGCRCAHRHRFRDPLERLLLLLLVGFPQQPDAIEPELSRSASCCNASISPVFGFDQIRIGTERRRVRRADSWSAALRSASTEKEDCRNCAALARSVSTLAGRSASIRSSCCRAAVNSVKAASFARRTSSNSCPR